MSNRDSVLLFAGGCLTGAVLGSIILTAQQQRKAARLAAEHHSTQHLASSTPTSTEGKPPAATPSKAAESPVHSGVAGGLRPYQHEARIKERVDRMEANESFRGERLGTATRNALREMIREEVVSL